MTKLLLDNELVDADAVSMRVSSRGFAFGFGVFETMKFLDGRPCFLAEHVARLKRAVSVAGLKVVLDEVELRKRASRLFAAENAVDGVFKIVVSDDGDNTRVAMYLKSRDLCGEPNAVCLTSSEVRKASLAFTSQHKSLNYMESMLELEKANEAGFDECVFRNEHDQITECAIANLFWITNGILNTPAIDCGLLDGIVRRKVIGLARGWGIRVEEGRFDEGDLLAADEAFLTSSGKGPRSVSSFSASTKASKSFSGDFLPRLRSAYLELEKEEACKADG